MALNRVREGGGKRRNTKGNTPKTHIAEKGYEKAPDYFRTLEESVELGPTDYSEEYQPPAKCTRRKLRDGDSNS